MSSRAHHSRARLSRRREGKWGHLRWLRGKPNPSLTAGQDPRGPRSSLKVKKIPTDPKRDTDSAENLPGGGATLRTFAKEPGLFRDALAPARESENSPATFNPKTATLPAPWNKVPG